MISSTQNDAAERAALAGGLSGPGAGGEHTAAGTEDRFLQLLVAQMRNQDPLAPMDNAQITSQLAQINTVRGIEELNQSMAKMAAASTAISPLSVVGMLGRQVLIEGDRIEWPGADADPESGDPAMPTIDRGDTPSVRIGFEIPAAARTVRVEIVDASGQVVRSEEFSEPKAGVHTFDWDGTDDEGRAVGAGKYELRAYEGDGQDGATPVLTLVPARVHGVNQAPGGARLDLVGYESVAASAIRAVL